MEEKINHCDVHVWKYRLNFAPVMSEYTRTADVVKKLPVLLLGANSFYQIDHAVLWNSMFMLIIINTVNHCEFK